MWLITGAGRDGRDFARAAGASGARLWSAERGCVKVWEHRATARCTLGLTASLTPNAVQAARSVGRMTSVNNATAVTTATSRKNDARTDRPSWPQASSADERPAAVMPVMRKQRSSHNRDSSSGVSQRLRVRECIRRVEVGIEGWMESVRRGSRRRIAQPSSIRDSSHELLRSNRRTSQGVIADYERARAPGSTGNPKRPSPGDPAKLALA